MPSPVLLRRAAWASAAVAAASLVLLLVVRYATEGSGDPAGTTPTTAGRGPVHVEVLRAWDGRRARAWARGDVAALRSLYTAGSRTGVQDRRMLRRYLDRGLRVEGLRTQLLSVEVATREEARLVLDVVDRVSAAEVVGEGIRRELPADRPSSRRVELRRERGEWRVVEAVAR